jgi:predicted nucleic acid-binding protein
MIRVFLDASVVFAAAYSHSGAARELLHRGLQGDVRLVVSQDVLEETTRNLARKAPELIPILERLLGLLELEVCADPTKEEVWAA